MSNNFLSPDAAYANTWKRHGFDEGYPIEYFDDEDVYEIEPTTIELTEEIEKAFDHDQEDLSLDLVPELDATRASYSRQSSHSTRRSSSLWSINSVLTNISTPSLSRRQSWMGSVKAASPEPPQRNRFKDVPQEILVTIVKHLRAIHEDPGSSTCSSCFNADAFNLSLVCRAWDKAVKPELYRNIHLDGLDAPSKRMRLLRTTAISRMRLLRRTLRERASIAKSVEELRIWNPSKSLNEEMLDRMATIVMACPNLRIFEGTQPFYCHSFSRLHHALSTRKHLNSHLWIIGTTQGVLRAETDQFLGLHERWENLTTLALRCQRGAMLEQRVFSGITKRLSSLTDLSISGFGPESFNDQTLLALGPLKALRLADLPGLSDKGLSQFSNAPTSQSLHCLALIGLNLSSLYTISRLLSNLRLEKFTLTQYRQLTIPAEDLVMQPLLASRELVDLHWEMPLAGTELSSGSQHLVCSIEHDGFPSLARLRCPIDTDDGDIQLLCKPQIPPTNDSPMSSNRIVGTTRRAVELRATSRVAAGIRGELYSGIVLQVTTPEDEIEYQEDIDWLGYVGYDRNIEYSLHSDLGPRERRKFLAEEGDMLGGVEESTGASCQGQGLRKHIDRPRWNGSSIQSLF